jgi:glycosyltransferase involved in cell wall biosynthesis
LNEDKPLINVITVVLNDVTNIEETLISVVNQDYVNINYIVIDGNSVDGTIEKIKLYEYKINKFISKSDTGIYNAMNNALKFCKNGWVIFMNSGDTFSSTNILSKIFLKSFYNSSNILYGNHIVKYNNIQINKNPSTLDKLWKGMTIQHQSIFIHTNIYSSYKYDEKYVFAADFDLIYKLYKNNFMFKYLNLNISIVTPNGLSESNNLRTYKEFKLIVLKNEKNSTLINSYYFLTLLQRNIINSIVQKMPLLKTIYIKLKQFKQNKKMLYRNDI